MQRKIAAMRYGPTKSKHCRRCLHLMDDRILTRTYDLTMRVKSKYKTSVCPITKRTTVICSKMSHLCRKKVVVMSDSPNMSIGRMELNLTDAITIMTTSIVSILIKQRAMCKVSF